jgi:non-specific serine/threonine protein kinase
MTLAQAVNETLDWLAESDDAVREGTGADGEDRPAPAPVQPAPAATRAPSGTAPLTPREREVAALIARGMTNRQIAEELVITEGTAANHVKHILARLTLDSRVQIATWAVERGLHHAASS